MNNIYAQRVENIRKKMQANNIGLYFIPMDDCHGSEYVADHFRCIEYVSGFTGSAGQLIITDDGAWLYADGRYYVQAERQLEGSTIELMKLAYKGVPAPVDFIAQKMQEIQEKDSEKAFGFDGNVVNKKQADRFVNAIAEKCGMSAGELKTVTDLDLAGEVWTDRPAQEFTKAWILEDRYTGENSKSKLKRLREELKKEAGDKEYIYFLSSLDDIAWLFNMRGNDIPDNPECFAYAEIRENSACLFLGEGAADESFKNYLNDQGVELKIYSKDCLKEESRGIVLMDFSRISYSIYDHYKKQGSDIKNIITPTTLMKALKNETELKNACSALLRDSANVTKFMCWLKGKIKEAGPGQALKNDDGTVMTELSVDDKLDEIRTKDSLYIEKSFATIAAYKDNGAMMHYQAKPDNYKELSAEGMLLIDSGVQFMDGTTDITRTFILGPITDEEKKAFTLTAVSMLRLMNAKFIEGCTGENLDAIAREVMWNEGWDYKCGTGHGVGHVLNVHEGPHALRWRFGSDGPTTALKEGMVVTDEPGVYREGRYGIRTENEIYVKAYKETEDGKFLCFEPMTYIPIDLDGIDKTYMSESDIRLLNEYHKRIYDKLKDMLDEDTLEWLKEYTREI